MLSGGRYFDDTQVSDVSRLTKLIKTLLKGILLHVVLARNFRFVQFNWISGVMFLSRLVKRRVTD